MKVFLRINGPDTEICFSNTKRISQNLIMFNAGLFQILGVLISNSAKFLFLKNAESFINCVKKHMLVNCSFKLSSKTCWTEYLIRIFHNQSWATGQVYSQYPLMLSLWPPVAQPQSIRTEDCGHRQQKRRFSELLLQAHRWAFHKDYCQIISGHKGDPISPKADRLHYPFG